MDDKPGSTNSQQRAMDYKLQTKQCLIVSGFGLIVADSLFRFIHFCYGKF